MNSGEQVFVRTYVILLCLVRAYVLSDVYWRVELLGHMITLCLTFWGTPKNVTQSRFIILHLPPAVYVGFWFRHVLTNNNLFFIIIAILVSVWWYLIAILICLSLMANDTEHLCIYFFLTFKYLIGRNAYSNPCPFLIRLFVTVLLNHETSLYIFGYSMLIRWFANRDTWMIPFATGLGNIFPPFFPQPRNSPRMLFVEDQNLGPPRIRTFRQLTLDHFKWWHQNSGFLTENLLKKAGAGDQKINRVDGRRVVF